MSNKNKTHIGMLKIGQIQGKIAKDNKVAKSKIWVIRAQNRG